MPPTCDESVSPTTSGSAVVEDKVQNQNKDTDEEIECARGAEVPNSPEIESEAVELPKRVFARSISECEGAADDSQRSILRNPQVTEIRSILEKRQSFDLPAEGRPPVNVGSEQDVIERYYQRNQATINSLQSRALEPVRRTRETRHPVSLASRRSGQSEVVMPSPKVTERKTYLLFASLFIYEYDALSGPAGSGIDFFHSFYFSFISITTIGLGDIMPNNVTFAPIITVLFFFGMPILKVVNRSTYICVENGVFGTLTVCENRLDSCWTGVQHQPNDNEAQPVSPRPSVRSRRSESQVRDGESSDEENENVERMNNFTIRSIATFMRSHSDVYGGDFGRVNLRRGDLLPHNNDTVRSTSSATRHTESQAPR
ncbi:hypothetical protein V3C99_007410 [Haemonchus contortus]